jgi:hypothetical protein
MHGVEGRVASYVPGVAMMSMSMGKVGNGVKGADGKKRGVDWKRTWCGEERKVERGCGQGQEGDEMLIDVGPAW